MIGEMDVPMPYKRGFVLQFTSRRSEPPACRLEQSVEAPPLSRHTASHVGRCGPLLCSHACCFVAACERGGRQHGFHHQSRQRRSRKKSKPVRPVGAAPELQRQRGRALRTTALTTARRRAIHRHQLCLLITYISLRSTRPACSLPSPPPREQNGQKDETVRVLEIFTDSEYPDGAAICRYFWEPWMLPDTVAEFRERRDATTRECFETVNGAPGCGETPCAAL